MLLREIKRVMELLNKKTKRASATTNKKKKKTENHAGARKKNWLLFNKPSFYN